MIFNSTEEQNEMDMMMDLSLINPTTSILEIENAKSLHITDGGKLCTPKTDELFAILKEYGRYCSERTKSDWEKLVDELKEATIQEPNDANMMLIYMLVWTGEVIERIKSGRDWKEIRNLINEQSHSGLTYNNLCEMVLVYSDKGIEFIEHFFTEDEINDDSNPLHHSLMLIYRKIKQNRP